MKNLKDVLEKLKVDDIIIEKFPIDGTMDNIIRFLNEQGFEDIGQDLLVSIDDAFNDAEKRVYWVMSWDSTVCLWFTDTTKRKISKDNPIFFCSARGDMTVFYFMNDLSVDIVETGKDANTKRKFLKELNKRFGW